MPGFANVHDYGSSLWRLVEEKLAYSIAITVQEQTSDEVERG